MPACTINHTGKMDALEIEDELVEAIVEAGPNGLNYRQAAEILDMGYERLYRAANNLILMGRIKMERGQSGNEHRLILPEWEPPTLMLADKQRRVLDFLCSVMDSNGLVRISHGKIARETGCAAPSFAIERLDYKGFLEIVETGDPRLHTANLYRIYPNQDGPRGLSASWFKREWWRS